MSLSVKVLEESFALIKPHATQFASTFYYNLFQDNPQIEPLFANTNMVAQEEKLIQSLVLVVWNLRDIAHLRSILRDLGARHVRYGTVQTHYPMVGTALLKTLEFYLGSHWTPEVQQAWTDAYAAIVNLMLEGAESSNGMAELRNVPSPSTQLVTVDLTSTPSAATTSSQHDLEGMVELGDVPSPSTQPVTVDLTSTPPAATTSNFKPKKLTLILFVLASSFGIGLLCYYSYLTIKAQTVTTSTEKNVH